MADNDGITKVLSTIGIQAYDPLVVVALNEYARRFATEILCDAKDYSTHANKTEMDNDDLRLAVLLSNVKTTGMTSSVLAGLDVFHELNAKPLPDISSDAIFHRVPGVFAGKDKTSGQNGSVEVLLTRNYSFVPGVEAYPSVNTIIARANALAGTNQNQSSAQKAKKPRLSIPGAVPVQLLNSDEREQNKEIERMREIQNRMKRPAVMGEPTTSEKNVSMGLSKTTTI